MMSTLKFYKPLLSLEFVDGLKDFIIAASPLYQQTQPKSSYTAMEASFLTAYDHTAALLNVILEKDPQVKACPKSKFNSKSWYDDLVIQLNQHIKTVSVPTHVMLNVLEILQHYKAAILLLQMESRGAPRAPSTP
jgi:hypothetical protein